MDGKRKCPICSKQVETEEVVQLGLLVLVAHTPPSKHYRTSLCTGSGLMVEPPRKSDPPLHPQPSAA